jgi:hypothetical protein
MTAYCVTPLNEGWWQIEECRSDGSIAAIGCFRTEADAQAWLTTYARIQLTAARVFRVGRPEDLPIVAAKDPTTAGEVASD